MQTNPKHDAYMPNRMRSTADPVEPVMLLLVVQEALGEVRNEDDEAERIDSY